MSQCLQFFVVVVFTLSPSGAGHAATPPATPASFRQPMAHGVDVTVRNVRRLLDEFAGEHEHRALLGPGLRFWENGPSPRPRLL
jgi:hypothetical protein